MMNETAQQNMENHPVIRTLYDHVDEVTCLAFHPTEQILASGSRDYTLKLFDYSKPSAKRAFKYIQVLNSRSCSMSVSVVVMARQSSGQEGCAYRRFTLYSSLSGRQVRLVA